MICPRCRSKAKKVPKAKYLGPTKLGNARVLLYGHCKNCGPVSKAYSFKPGTYLLPK